MKKACLTVAAVLLAVLVLPACDGTNNPPDSATLSLMGKQSDLEKPYMKRIFDRYEDETDIRLNIISIEDAKFETTASEKIKKGETPDILLHFHNSDLARYDVAGNFLYLNDEDWVDDLTDSALAYCKDGDGNLLGLPFWESSVSGCFYNKTLLNGLGLGDAASQADFNGLCRALMEVGQTPICWPADGCSWMLQFGLDPIFADNAELLEKLNANEITYSEIPAVKNMLQWLADAAKSGWFGSDYSKIGWDEISGKLSSGEAAMTFIWDTWFYTDFKPGKYKVDDFAIMPVFFDTTPDGTYEGGNLNMMMVNKNSEKRDLALGFLEFCATPENYNFAFDGIATVNCFKGQTTNIQSKMVTDAKTSIANKERVSTAATKILGYSADDLVVILNDLLNGKITVTECVKKFDENRISRARNEGFAGF